MQARECLKAERAGDMKVSEKRRSLLKAAYSKTRRDQLVKGDPKSQALKYMALVD